MNAITVSLPKKAVDPDDAEFVKEKMAFWRLFGELLKTYENQFVAIYKGQVVASGANKLDVYRKAFELHGNVPMFIHLVSMEPEPIYRVFSPKVSNVTGP